MKKELGTREREEGCQWRTNVNDAPDEGKKEEDGSEERKREREADDSE